MVESNKRGDYIPEKAAFTVKVIYHFRSETDGDRLADVFLDAYDEFKSKITEL